MKKHTAYISALLGITMLLGSCTNILSPPEVREAVPAGKGRLAIQVKDGVRTALPSGTFDRYVLGFTYTGGPESYIHGDVEWSTGETVDLEAGTWIITLNAYASSGDVVVSGTGSEEVTVYEGTTTPVTLRVGMMNTGSGITGTLQYTVSYPTDAAYGEQKLYVYNMAGALEDGYPVTVTNGLETDLTLLAGVYRVRVVVKNTDTNTTASAAIVAHIYGNKTTPVGFNFVPDDFTASLPLAVNAALDVPYGVESRTVGVYVVYDAFSPPTGLPGKATADLQTDGGPKELVLLIPSAEAAALRVFVRQDIQVGGVIYKGNPQPVTFNSDPNRPPDAVSIDDVYYKVAIDPGIDGGTVKAMSEETLVANEGISIAREGTEVTLAVTPDTSPIKRLRPESLTYNYNDGGTDREIEPDPVEENIYSFYMPPADVTIDAEFVDYAIRYVVEGGAGSKDGSSWTNASDDIQKMMDELAALSDGGYSGPDRIVKLGAGTYTPQWAPGPDGGSIHKDSLPGDRTDRDRTFILRQGVQVWGGYPAGGGADSGRDPATNITTLSGDLLGNDFSSDPTTLDENAYHVVLAVGTAAAPITNTTVLDGLAISGGNASSSSSLTVGSYNIERQNAGGIYNRNASPALNRVMISGNTATVDGGGMYNRDGSSPKLVNVTISDNHITAGGGGGGGMFNYGNSSPTLEYVTISNNTAVTGGGGMYNNYTSSPTLTNVTISNNTAATGGGMYNNNISSPEMEDVTISGNIATGNGGGIYNENSSPELDGVTIGGTSAGEENTAKNGGGMYNNGSSPVLKNGTAITGNKATGAGNGNDSGGGGMYNNSSSPVLVNVTISGNLADVPYGEGYYGGGGIFNYNNSSPVLINVTISGNKAIVANDTTVGGGGMFNFNSSSPVLINVTIAGNEAGGPAARGGGMSNHSDSLPVIRNSIIWGNAASTSNSGIYNSYETPSIKYSMVEGESGGTDGNQSAPGASPFADWKDPASYVMPNSDGEYWLNNTGNADNAKDKGFNDNYPDTWVKWNDNTDLTGKITEPVYTNYVLPSITKDLGGVGRFNGIIDMGAYEYQEP